MPVLEDELGILARRRIEAQIIKPIYEILKRDVGIERAQAVIAEAIREAAISSGQQFAAREPQGPSVRSFIALQVLWEKDDALEIDVLRADDTHYDYDVKRCRYAEMYHEMGLGEIGHLLSCARDSLFIEGYDPSVQLERTTTIMQGGPRCDFRYRTRDTVQNAKSVTPQTREQQVQAAASKLDTQDASREDKSAEVRPNADHGDTNA